MPSGTTITHAGNGYEGIGGGSGEKASFSYPTGLTIDMENNLFIADQHNHTIRKISPTGNVTSIAGGFSSGDLDGNGALARFDFPSGIVATRDGYLYVTDCYNHKIKKISSTGEVITYAGTGSAGAINGNVKASRFNYPFGIALDIDDNLYIADTFNNQIRKISNTGEVTTYAGSIKGSNDGTIKTARFNNPYGVAIDNVGNVYVADSGNNKIRKITPQGMVSTIAGSDISGSVDGIGGAAQFNFPTGIFFDATEQTIYIADRLNQKIRKVDINNEVTTVSGSGVKGAVDGVSSEASFYNPSGVVMDMNKNIYVADALNNKIRKSSQLSFTISPDLPVGLLFDEATGAITGAPLVVSSFTTYTITGYNSFGENSTEISFSTSNSLSVNDVVKNFADLMIYNQNEVLVIDAQKSKINTLKIHDTNGRILLEKKNLNVTSVSISDLYLRNQLLLIQIINSDNEVINRKIIYY